MVDTSQIPPHMLPPDPNTEEGRKKLADIRKYNESIGKLVTMFPAIEVGLFTILGSLWDVPLPVAKAVYGDLRIDAAMSTARRLVDARQQVWGKNLFETEIAKWLDYIFAQLSIINGIRNHIIHHGIMGTTDYAKPVASNRLRARGDAQLKEIVVSPEEVDAMNHDLTGVIALLSITGQAILAPKISQPLFAMLEKASREQPWRYKSPLQGGKKDNSQGKAQGQKAGPQSSLG